MKELEMNWTEIKVEVPAQMVEKAGNIANMVVPYGIYIEDYSNLEEEATEIAHIDLIDEELLGKDRSKAWIHVYISPEDKRRRLLSRYGLWKRHSVCGRTAFGCRKRSWSRH